MPCVEREELADHMLLKCNALVMKQGDMICKYRVCQWMKTASIFSKSEVVAQYSEDFDWLIHPLTISSELQHWTFCEEGDHTHY